MTNSEWIKLTESQLEEFTGELFRIADPRLMNVDMPVRLEQADADVQKLMLEMRSENDKLETKGK